MALDPVVTKQSDGRIKLSWTPDLTAFGYRFYRDGVAVSKGSNPAQKSTTFGKETDDKQHTYGISMAKEAGLESAEYPPDPTPPDPPPGPKPTMNQTADGTITWDPTVGAAGYEIASVPPTGATLYDHLEGGARMFKPPARPGLKMEYDVASRMPNGTSTWYSGGDAGRLKFTWPGTPPPTPVPPSPTGQLIGIDFGGWDGSARCKAAGVGYFRTNASGRSQIPNWKSKGMQLLTTCIGEGGSIGGIDPNRYAADLRSMALSYGPARYEILNEPEGEWFWSDANTTGSAQALARIVKACRASTKDIPGIKLCVSLQDRNGWQDKILAALDPGDYDEGIIHPYGGSSKNAASAAGNRNSVVKANQRSGKLIAITEVGWPTAVGKPATGDSAQWTETEQAANIEEFCKWVRANPNLVSIMSYFAYHDYGSNMWYGIVDMNDKTKPGLAALAKYAND